MNTEQIVQRDERTVAVENASYRWAFILLTYALLVDVIYRGAVRQEAAWDLLAMVIVVGLVCTFYQARQKIMPQGWVMKALLIAGIGGLVAAVAAVLMVAM